MNFRRIKTYNDIEITIGLVVWCYLEGFPWWPALVVNRDEHEPNLDDGESLPPETESNKLVEFFNDDKRVAVIELSFLREYTSNMHLCRQKCKLSPDMLKAAEEANLFIESQGLEEQKANFKKLESFEVLKKGKLHEMKPIKRESAIEPSKCESRDSSVPSSGKRRSTSKYRRQPAEDAEGEKYEADEPEPSPSLKRRKSKDSRFDDQDDNFKVLSSTKRRTEKHLKSNEEDEETRVEPLEAKEKNYSDDKRVEELRIPRKNREKSEDKEMKVSEAAAQEKEARKKARLEKKAAKLKARALVKERLNSRASTERNSKTVDDDGINNRKEKQVDVLSQSKLDVKLKQSDSQSKLKVKSKPLSAKQKAKSDVKLKSQAKSKTKVKVKARSEADSKSDPTSESVAVADIGSELKVASSKSNEDTDQGNSEVSHGRRRFRADRKEEKRDFAATKKRSKIDVDVTEEPSGRSKRNSFDGGSSKAGPGKVVADKLRTDGCRMEDKDDVDMFDDDDRPGVEVLDVDAVMASENPQDSDIVPEEDLDRVDVSTMSVKATLKSNSELKDDFEELQVNVVKFIEGLQDIAYLRDLLKKKMEHTKALRLKIHENIETLMARDITLEQLQATQAGGKIVGIIEKTWKNTPFLAEELVPLAENWSGVVSRSNGTGECTANLEKAKQRLKDCHLDGNMKEKARETPKESEPPTKKRKSMTEGNVTSTGAKMYSKSNNDIDAQLTIKRTPDGKSQTDDHFRDKCRLKNRSDESQSPSPASKDLGTKDPMVVDKADEPGSSYHAKPPVNKEERAKYPKLTSSKQAEVKAPGKSTVSPNMQASESTSSQGEPSRSSAEKRRPSKEERYKNFDDTQLRKAMSICLQKFKLGDETVNRLVDMFDNESKKRSHGSSKLYFNLAKKCVVVLKSKNGKSMVEKALKYSSADCFFD